MSIIVDSCFYMFLKDKVNIAATKEEFKEYCSTSTLRKSQIPNFIKQFLLWVAVIRMGEAEEVDCRMGEAEEADCDVFFEKLKP